MNKINSEFNACMHKDTCIKLQSRIAQLEADLEAAKKDQARYKFVRNMTPEDFGNLSTINDDFDSQVDAAIKGSQIIAQDDCDEKPCSFCFSRDCNGTCISGLDN